MSGKQIVVEDLGLTSADGSLSLFLFLMTMMMMTTATLTMMMMMGEHFSEQSTMTSSRRMIGVCRAERFQGYNFALLAINLKNKDM